MITSADIVVGAEGKVRDSVLIVIEDANMDPDKETVVVIEEVEIQGIGLPRLPDGDAITTKTIEYLINIFNDSVKIGQIENKYRTIIDKIKKAPEISVVEIIGEGDNVDNRLHRGVKLQ